LTLPQSEKCGGKRGAEVHGECAAWVHRALQAIENVLQEEVILLHRTYRQNRNNSVPRDLGEVIHYNILPTTLLLFSGTEEERRK
jgi:hypothetical protein